jgi:hypothetical protein
LNEENKNWTKYPWPKNFENNTNKILIHEQKNLYVIPTGCNMKQTKILLENTKINYTSMDVP